MEREGSRLHNVSGKGKFDTFYVVNTKPLHAGYEALEILDEFASQKKLNIFGWTRLGDCRFACAEHGRVVRYHYTLGVWQLNSKRIPKRVGRTRIIHFS